MNRRRQPPRRADEHLRWLRGVGEARDTQGSSYPGTQGIHLLIPGLTGADYAALEAIAAAWETYPRADDGEHVLAAVAHLALCMQEKSRPLARELIARSLDWGDRDRLWPQVEALIDGLSLDAH